MSAHSQPLDAFDPDRELERYRRHLHDLAGLSAARAGMVASAWYEGTGWHVYSRLGAMVVAGQVVRCVCVANIELDVSLRGQGFFARLVATVRSQSAVLHTPWLKVESVLEDRFAEHLLREGFTPASTDPFVRDYCLRLCAD